MSNPNALILKALGLNTQPNELAVPEGSLSVAENVEISRDGVVQVATGFEDFSGNMPDFEVQQLFSFGGVMYAIADDGWWYYDTASSTWLRKRGNLGAAISAPSGMAYAAGHIYATSSRNVIFDIDLLDGSRTVLAGRFGASAAHTDGTGDAARFANPRGITTDGTNLYVADVDNNCIRKIVISSGIVTTPYGVAAPATTSAHTDGTGNAARFTNPVGITINGADLYVADSGNNCIRKVVISSGVVTTPYGVADPATTNGHTDGTGNAARFTAPFGITTDGTNLYVADFTNNCIRKIVISSGVVTTPYGVADPATTSGHTDATGNAARFSGPIGLTILGTDLYVADLTNSCIRKIVISSGVVTTPCGIAAPSSTGGHVDGIGNAARFDDPYDVVTDGTNLYVADNVNHCIRKIYVSTGYVSTVDGTGGIAAWTTGLNLANGVVIGPT